MNTDLKALIIVLSLIVVLCPITIFPFEKILHPVRIAPDFIAIPLALISTSVSLAFFPIETWLEYNLEFSRLAEGDILLIGDFTIVRFG
jgi:hypothetical protein